MAHSLKGANGHIGHKAAREQPFCCPTAPPLPNSFYHCFCRRVVNPPKGQPIPVRQRRASAHRRLSGIIDQRNGQVGQQEGPPFYGTQHRTGAQRYPASHRIQRFSQFAENIRILKHLQISRDDQIRQNGIGARQILRHMLRIPQTKIAHLQLNLIGEQPLRQHIKKCLFLTMENADMIPVEQDMCHARNSPFRSSI